MSVFFKRRGDVPEAFSVSNSLTHCSSSNPATSIRAGKPYTATITMESGFSTLSVTVTMGGVDVTASVYSNGVISIPAVTGDIVVTAIAAATIPMTITGNGDQDYCYLSINGTKYSTAGTFDVLPGSVITFAVYSRTGTDYNGWVKINGVTVFNSSSGKLELYNWTIPNDVSSVRIDMEYKVILIPAYGRFTVTTA